MLSRKGFDFRQERAAARLGELWAVVLAGGEGWRLEPSPRQRGQPYPVQQFCAAIGRRAMLQHTWKRVEMLVTRERVLTVIDTHAESLRNQLASRAYGTVIHQPANRESAPATLLPLAHVLRADANAIVGVFPCDHFVPEGERFMAHVQMAEWVIRRGIQDMVVLGVVPDRPDSAGRWIEVNRAGRLPGSCLLPVRRFWEKPDPSVARSLLVGGHLLNTMVTVARAAALWELIGEAQPELRGPFERIRRALGTANETAEVVEAYEQTPSRSLSRGVFGRFPSRLAAMTVHKVHWSEWERDEWVGEPLRWLGDGSLAPSDATPLQDTAEEES